MSVECVVKPKLSDDECANRNRANQRAWDAKHAEQRRLYRISNVRRQKQALLDSGFVPKPVGRPKRDPDTTTKACIHRERGDTYREYQRGYQRLLRARRRAGGWGFNPLWLYTASAGRGATESSPDSLVRAKPVCKKVLREYKYYHLL